MSYGCSIASVKEIPYIKWDTVVLTSTKENERSLATCLGASGKLATT